MTVYRVTFATSYQIDTEDYQNVLDEGDAVDIAIDMFTENLDEPFPIKDLFGIAVEEER